MTTPPTPTSLSIGALSRSTGVPVETIRMWERRYGRPRAERRGSGHRRYSQTEARWLRRIAEAVALGVRPSVAIAADAETLERRLARLQPSEPPGLDAWLALARSYDTQTIRARLRAAWATGTTCAVVEGTLGPLVAAVGRAWANGRLEVRHEHFLTDAIGCALRAARDDVVPRPGAPVIVFAALPTERHALGLEMAAAVAAHAGARTVVLGADMPLPDIAAAAGETGAVAVVLSVSVAHGGADADRELNVLRELLPAATRLVVGGGGARRRRRQSGSVERVSDFKAFDAMVRSLGPRREPA